MPSLRPFRGTRWLLPSWASPMRSAAVSVLVASDKRLLRAAKAEGLEVLNPETVQAADIPAFLAAL